MTRLLDSPRLPSAIFLTGLVGLQFCHAGNTAVWLLVHSHPRKLSGTPAPTTLRASLRNSYGVFRISLMDTHVGRLRSWLIRCCSMAGAELGVRYISGRPLGFTASVL